MIPSTIISSGNVSRILFRPGFFLKNRFQTVAIVVSWSLSGRFSEMVGVRVEE